MHYLRINGICWPDDSIGVCWLDWAAFAGAANCRHVILCRLWAPKQAALESSSVLRRGELNVITNENCWNARGQLQHSLGPPQTRTGVPTRTIDAGQLDGGLRSALPWGRNLSILTSLLLLVRSGTLGRHFPQHQFYRLGRRVSSKRQPQFRSNRHLASSLSGSGHTKLKHDSF